MIDVTNALQTLAPNAQWIMRDDELEWLDATQTQPTEAEITAEISRLQAEYDSKQYQRDRAEAYPSTVDQLDDIYHNGVDGWKATIKAVKDTYPKETI
jgi:uncharacterized small protein (DUF1192 family)